MGGFVFHCTCWCFNIKARVDRAIAEGEDEPAVRRMTAGRGNSAKDVK